MTTTNTFLRSRWRGMHARCNATKGVVSRNYRERGITVCAEWHDFDAFKAYVLATIGLPDFSTGIKWTLDREDNDKGYAPGNVRWATYRQNTLNSRAVRWVEYKGRRLVLTDLAAETGISYGLLADRIWRHGWSVDKAVETPTLPKSVRTVETTWNHEIRITRGGVEKTLREWSKELGFDATLVRGRLGRGWSFEDAISSPPDKGKSGKDRASRFDYMGRPMTIAQLSEATGIKAATLRYRLFTVGLDVADAVAPLQSIRKASKAKRGGITPDFG